MLEIIHSLQKIFMTRSRSSYLVYKIMGILKLKYENIIRSRDVDLSKT